MVLRWLWRRWKPILLSILLIKLFLTTTTLSPLSFLLQQPSSKPPNPPLKSPCTPPLHNSHLLFCNTSVPIQTRAQNLLSLLTLQEKINLLANNATPISRFSISAYEWWSESLHGLASNGPGVTFTGPVSSATVFPQVLLTTASFNRSLWFLIGKAIGVEARAMYNVGQAGLTFWAPNVNVFRDPRWGRGQETPGEDPMVAAEYAVEYVRGLQGEGFGGGGGGDGGLMVSACCKHFIAYDLENWGNFTSFGFNAMVTRQDLEDTYQPPFQSCVEEGRASCLMCAYNQVNGVPSCAHRNLLQKARIEWGFQGYITTDCDAVAVIYEYQRYSEAPEDAVADVIKAGVDMNCGTYFLQYTQLAIKQSKIQEDDIDRALLNLLSVQFRLGFFNGEPGKGSFANLGPPDVCSAEHRKLALEAARQGIVLLKNENKFLPLNQKLIASLAIIGPLANDSSQLGGDYTGVPCNSRSLFEGFWPYVSKTLYASGCSNIQCNSSDGFAEAVHVSRESDVGIVIAGLDLSQENEGRDRVSLLLPGRQMDLISAVSSANKAAIILILMGGGPIDVSFAKENPEIASILWIGYPGEAGGQAIAEVIFGKLNPGGRLPMTWYPESFTNVPMNDMSLRSNPSRGYPGRTYRFYTGDVVYEFGHGLSYSNYTCKFASLPDKVSLPTMTRVNKTADGIDYVDVNKITSCNLLRFQAVITVFNNEGMDGNHVVMLFTRLARRIRGAPRKTLIGFTRVLSKLLTTAETSIQVDPCKHFSIVDDNGTRILPLGKHIVMLEGLEHFVSVEIPIHHFNKLQASYSSLVGALMGERQGLTFALRREKDVVQIKGSWSPEEDELLQTLVQRHGPRN
ncbi:hypothetical protein TEA_021291 [Camellia sinensis var. sinensis]|uniref:HTH myb-type domain-containing protein n=1 Tax=Camellia sinensis var. sinensis TaxID=542762 RepID=A0A4S4D3J5_CAMSN|nr:hypothetical protein TEA_021291 [Camellia sinensis var. sinensis]